MPQNATQQAGNAPNPPDLSGSKLQDYVSALLTQQASQLAGREQAVAAPKLRWEPHPDRNPPCVVIHKRGSKKPGVKTYIATISKDGALAALYPSWEPALAEWARRRAENGGKRQKLAELAAGSIPAERQQ